MFCLELECSSWFPVLKELRTGSRKLEEGVRRRGCETATKDEATDHDRKKCRKRGCGQESSTSIGVGPENRYTLSLFALLFDLVVVVSSRIINLKKPPSGDNKNPMFHKKTVAGRVCRARRMHRLLRPSVNISVFLHNFIRLFPAVFVVLLPLLPVILPLVALGAMWATFLLSSFGVLWKSALCTLITVLT